MKKIISTILAIVLLVSLCPFTVSANANNGTFTYTLDANNNATITGTVVNANVTDLNIPSTIDGYKVKAIGDSAFEGDIFGSVILPETLEAIERKAFYGARVTQDTTIRIPASANTIGDYAFNYFYGVEAFNVDEGNLNYASYGNALFTKDLSVLYAYPIGSAETSFTVPRETTRLYCTSFGNARNLKTLIVLNSNVRRMGYTFFRCDLQLYGDANLVESLRLSSLTSETPYGKVTYVSNKPPAS